MKSDIAIFGLDSTKQYAQRVAKHLDLKPTEYNNIIFDDEEEIIQSNESVRGKDVYIISSLYSDFNYSASEKLMKLYMFACSLRDASARRVNIISPYMSYARQDRKTAARAPISTKYVAQLLEAAKIDRFITIDVHNLSAMQNSFRIPTDHLEAKNLIADFLCGGIGRDGLPIENFVTEPLIEDPTNIVVLSPDSGGLGRARRFRNALEKRLSLQNQIAVRTLDKERSDNKVKGGEIDGNIDGKKVIIFDDMISTASTMKLCIDTITKNGGKLWAICASHGLFVGSASDKLDATPRLVVTDTIPPFRMPKDIWKDKLFVISTTKLVAQAIKRTYENGSISDLLED
jgi:ribose-phosphate pyrophosphokinase